MSRDKKQPSIEQRIVTGIAKALWALVSLPFKKKKSGDIVKRWKEVRELMEQDNMHAWAMAIMKADSILDSVIMQRVDGNTLGERLRNMEGNISRDALQSAWDGHKLRNQIAHGESDISHKVAQDAIANFRKVLDELGEM